MQMQLYLTYATLYKKMRLYISQLELLYLTIATLYLDVIQCLIIAELYLANATL